MNTMMKTTGILCAFSLLGACGVAKTTAKVASMPVKATVKTGELATKGVYHTGKTTGTATLKTGEIAGKGVYYTGKGTGTAALKTGEIAGKGVYYTGKGTGKAALKTGELAGKGVYYSGKGAYHTAKVPVVVMNNALDTSAKVLSVTTQVVDLTGKVVTVSRNVNRAEVHGYIAQARGAANVLSIVVDLART